MNEDENITVVQRDGQYWIKIVSGNTKRETGPLNDPDEVKKKLAQLKVAARVEIFSWKRFSIIWSTTSLMTILWGVLGNWDPGGYAFALFVVFMFNVAWAFLSTIAILKHK